jgi:LmbE family N-acetylglucosaminyl deacetylase
VTRSLAFVFAHPDDETFAVGGTIARYAASGVRCDLFCATDGDAGKNSGVPVSSRAELGAIRRGELAAAARVLGIDHVELAGHPDGALAEVDAMRLIGEIVRFLRVRRPDVIISFGPEGAPTGHKDHRAISRAATTAFFLAGLATEFPDQITEGLTPHQPSRLFYYTWKPPAPEDELQLLGVPATTSVDVAAHLQRKRAAFLAHVSQRHHEQRFMKLCMRDEELYSLAAQSPMHATRANDLF